ncbi:MAG: hypothetical protein EBT91_00250 [Rhodobacteraceae bacterium]|nr:hypothetical protein [Paracoccaceae bacterium]
MAKRARGPRPNRTRPIHLITRYALCAALLFAGQATSAAEARLLSRFHWQTDNPELGGFSALEVGEDGLALTVLMDRGRLVQGRLLRTSAGIEGVSATAETNLLGLDGQPLSEDDDDSEGLVLDGLGGFSVASKGRRAYGTTLRPMRSQPRSNSAASLHKCRITPVWSLWRRLTAPY